MNVITYYVRGGPHFDQRGTQHEKFTDFERICSGLFNGRAGWLCGLGARQFEHCDASGFGNQLTVDQSGSGNNSTVDQDSTPTGSDGYANEATITQAGTGGASYVSQTGDNQLAITQSAGSSGMVAEVTQDNGGGASNIATIQQDGTGDGVAFGAALVQQTGTQGGVEITQEADTVDALAVVIQSGDGNTVEFEQDGPGPG